MSRFCIVSRIEHVSLPTYDIVIAPVARRIVIKLQPVGLLICSSSPSAVKHVAVKSRERIAIFVAILPTSILPPRPSTLKIKFIKGTQLTRTRSHPATHPLTYLPTETLCSALPPFSKEADGGTRAEGRITPTWSQ